MSNLVFAEFPIKSQGTIAPVNNALWTVVAGQDVAVDLLTVETHVAGRAVALAGPACAWTRSGVAILAESGVAILAESDVAT